VVGELDGVADQIREHLTHSAGITPKKRWHIPIDGGHQLEALSVGFGSQEIGDFLDDCPWGEVHDLQPQLARLDLREVEEIVDDREWASGFRGSCWRGSRS
jgi:hypothetical protein